MTENNTSARPDKMEVGWLFVQQYYTMLNEDPGRLHLFYYKNSQLTHGLEGETVPTYNGQQQISERIKEHQFQDCKVVVSNMDCQESANGAVVVQVLGEMSNRGGPSQKFVQTFFLAEQPRGYYVLNDIFRLLKEDIDYDDEVSVAAAQPAAQPATASAASVPVDESSLFSQPLSEDTNGSVTPVSAQPAAAPAAAPAQAPAQAPAEEQQAAGPASAESEPATPSAPAPEQPEQVRTNGTARSAAPKEVTRAEPAVPAAPVSWAALAAKTAKKAEANGNVHSPAQPQAQAQPAQQASAQAQAPAQSQTQTQTTPAQSQQQQHQPRDRSQVSAYLKHVVSRVEEDALRRELQKIGGVATLRVDRDRNCAFVDFADAATLKRALEQREVKVGDQTIVVEERKRPGPGAKRAPASGKKGSGNQARKSSNRA